MRFIISQIKGEQFLVIVPDTADVIRLKEAINNVTRKPLNLITIVYKGKVIDENLQLSAYGLKDMSKVFVAYKHEQNTKKKNQNYYGSSFTELSVPSECITSTIEHIKQKNPKAMHIINDAETVEDFITRSKEPDVFLARQRALDRIMDKGEMHVGGFQELVQRYYLIEEILEKNEEQLSFIPQAPTVIPDSPKEPSTAELPTPYGFEAKLQTLNAVLQNTPQNHINRAIIEGFVNLFSNLPKSNSLNNDSQESEQTFPAYSPSFVSQMEKPIIPHRTRTVQRARRLIPRRTMPAQFHTDNDDDEMGVDWIILNNII